MKLMFIPPLFFLLLCCAIPEASGVRIESVPEVDSDGVIQAELKQVVSLVCQPDGSLEPGADDELVWLRNGAVVSLKEGNKNGRSSVCVTPIVRDDNDATFTCHMKKNTTVSASVTLNVTYAPELSGSEEIEVEDTEELFLKCDIQANPPVSSVSWTLNGSRVDLLAGGFTVTNNGLTSVLSAHSTEKSLHEGMYECSAESPVYGLHRKLFHVTVTDKTMKFPLMPIIAGMVVVFLTALLAVVSRWNRITKCCK